MIDQRRYIITAFLILFTLAIGIFFISKISTETHRSINIEHQKEHTIKAPLATAGELIFKSKCASCHSVFKDMVGPALKDLEKRGPWGDRKKLYAWIHNPPMFMNQDQYTKNLKEQFGTLMLSFPTLSEKDIDAIVDFINNSTREEGGEPMQVAIR